MQAEIEIDGDEVTINSLVIDSPELVAYLDDYEEDDLSIPHNQMGIFDTLEPLPQFDHLTQELI